MIDFTKGLYQSDEYIKVYLNGNWCNISEAAYPDAWLEMEAWRAEHPGDLPLDKPPEPSKEVKAAQARFAILSQLQALDAQSQRALRAIATGKTTPSSDTTVEAQRLTDIETQAEALRAQLKEV